MKLQGWAVIAALGVASAGAVWAGDPATVYRMTHPRSCLGCDVSQMALPDGIDLSGYDLSKARLDGARAWRESAVGGVDGCGTVAGAVQRWRLAGREPWCGNA